MDTGSISYRRAFETYIRKGIPINLSQKQTHPTSHYVWRTRGDGKVRPSHAANDGKIFAWDNPPPTGHPGEDYGCRCIAEPYVANINEHIEIALSGISDIGSPWSSRDFVHHYFNGNGRGVAVRETGHLRSIVAEYRKIVIDDPTRLPKQIARKARETKNGSFSNNFYNTYDMTDVVFSLGDTTIGGKYTGNSSEENGILSVSGEMDFYLEDFFRDPLDIFDIIPGDNLELARSKSYRIYDNWQGRFEGKIYADASSSRFG
ncbi:hypothetical protein GGD81_003144 [Rhodobium orientis]|uniref:Phage head morphogenesis domain-containing protein n=1 Tax=Rhodobium orientis TaxID=34017 RepID=A0A327JVK8_9HYPH|nr:phage minor head protein [Rhodobium orientis]MBB4304089.1 hypothetical protein [Rhodobium orientis]MBK5948840.1 hypothetical protein [Rhodobium orientis]RAI29616.1 hypothetical protein CH339_02940 [Rhodobium orientis]